LHNVDNKKLILASVCLTLIASSFSLFALLFYKKKANLKSKLKKISFLSFFITSLSFFLFSFHVHEKTILLPLLPFFLCLSFKLIKNISQSFLTVSLFSLYPLLKRENQQIPYIILIIFVYFFTKFSLSVLESTNEKCEKKHRKLNLSWRILLLTLKILEYIDIIFIVGFHICELYIPVPARYPWIYPLINSSFAFLHFVLFYLIANLKIYMLFMK